MIKEYTYNIGHNNTTKKREVEKATLILKGFGLKGFNIVLNKGYWVGENKIYNENSFIICYLDLEKSFNEHKARELKNILKAQLGQEEIILSCCEKELL